MKDSAGPARRNAHSRWLRLLACFSRDTRGTNALEFGLLAFPFFGLIFGFVEVAYVAFSSEQLQAAVSRAARQVMTGQAQQNNYNTAAQFVSNLMCPTTGTRLLPAAMDCSRLIVDVRTATDFVSADTTNTFYKQPLKYCLGNPNTIVVVRVIYPLDAIFPLSIYNQYIGLANDFPNVSGWKHVLMGSAVLKTEPYSSGAPSC